MNIKLALCFIIFCAMSSATNAQPSPPSDSSFFEKDFAKSPLEHPENDRDVAVPSTMQPQRTIAPVRPESTAGFVELGPTPTIVATIGIDNAFGTRARTIGAIINGANTAHFVDIINQLIQVSRDRRISIGKIYLVANFSQYGTNLQQFLTDDYRTLASFEFINRMEIVAEPPPNYAVTTSPSWLIGTENGVVVAEGFAKLSDLINQEGMLRDLSTEKQVPTPSIEKLEPTRSATAVE